MLTGRRTLLLKTCDLGYFFLDARVCWHVVQHIVKELQCSVQLDLNPAWRFLYALPSVVRAPTLNKAQSKDT